MNPPTLRVLVVDDEPGFSRMLKLNLEEAGAFDVCTVNQSAEAIPAALHFKPDIILLDVVMPGMDGGDLAIEIRHRPQLKSIPIIFISAMVTRSESEEGVFMSGGERFLAKPVKLDVLTRAIQEIICASGEKDPAPPKPAKSAG